MKSHVMLASFYWKRPANAEINIWTDLSLSLPLTGRSFPSSCNLPIGFAESARESYTKCDTSTLGAQLMERKQQ